MISVDVLRDLGIVEPAEDLVFYFNGIISLAQSRKDALKLFFSRVVAVLLELREVRAELRTATLELERRIDGARRLEMLSAQNATTNELLLKARASYEETKRKHEVELRGLVDRLNAAERSAVEWKEKYETVVEEMQGVTNELQEAKAKRRRVASGVEPLKAENIRLQKVIETLVAGEETEGGGAKSQRSRGDEVRHVRF